MTSWMPLKIDLSVKIWTCSFVLIFSVPVSPADCYYRVYRVHECCQRLQFDLLMKEVPVFIKPAAISGVNLIVGLISDYCIWWRSIVPVFKYCSPLRLANWGFFNFSFFVLFMPFLRLLGVACLIAVPLGWLVINRWLQNFIYRVNVDVLVFLTSILLVALYLTFGVLFLSGDFLAVSSALMK